MDNFGEVSRFRDRRTGQSIDCWSVGSLAIPIDNYQNIIIQLRHDETHNDPHGNVDCKWEMVCGATPVRSRNIFGLPGHVIKL